MEIVNLPPTLVFTTCCWYVRWYIWNGL